MFEKIYKDEPGGLDAFTERNSSEGKLKVQAALADGEIPLDRVSVVIFKDLDDGRWVFFDGATDENGIIDGIDLPAPPYVQPTIDNVSGDFSFYDIQAKKNGYENINRRVSIFSGIRTLQPLNFSISEE